MVAEAKGCPHSTWNSGSFPGVSSRRLGQTVGVTASLRMVGLIGVVLGALLLGIDGRWVGGEEGRAFVVRLFGGELWSFGPDAFLAAALQYAPGLGAGAWDLGSGWVLAGWVHLVLAVAVGALVGPRLLRALDVGATTPMGGVPGGASLGRVAAALGCGLVLLFGTSPWLLSFVAQRSVQSGGAYLDLTDLARGAGIGLIWVGIGLLWPRDVGPGDGAAPGLLESKLSPWLAVLVATVVPLFLSAHYLGGEPLTNDGVAYQFQAELFADGELQRDVHGLDSFFPARQILPGNLATSKYPPGHSLVLAPGFAWGLKRLMPAGWAGLTVFLTWLLARRLGSTAPGAVTWFVALSPMFLGVETLWLSHGTSIPMCMVFAYFWIVARDRCLPMASTPGPRASASPIAPALLAGFALSIAFAARPLTALAFGLPCGVELLVAGLRARTRDHGQKPRPWTAALAGAVGFLPGLVFFMLINKAITGSAAKPAYSLYAELLSPNDQWGLMNLGPAFSYTAYNLARLWRGRCAGPVGVGLAASGRASARCARTLDPGCLAGPLFPTPLPWHPLGGAALSGRGRAPVRLNCRHRFACPCALSVRASKYGGLHGCASRDEHLFAVVPLSGGRGRGRPSRCTAIGRRGGTPESGRWGSIQGSIPDSTG